MAHNLNFTNDKAALAYVGDIPWHGFGTKLEGLATVKEMIAAAGLDWTVVIESVQLKDGPVIPAYKAIVRSDTRSVLGLTSKHYRTVQNAEAGDLMDDLMTEGNAHVEVGGALGKGERCWLLAHIPADFEVVKGDAIKPYLLMAWGHDGKHAVSGKLTPIRVVCQNTLDAATNGGQAGFSIRHSRHAESRISEIRKALGITKKQIESTAQCFQRMALKPLSDLESRLYIETVFPYASSINESDAEVVSRLFGSNAKTNELQRQAQEARERTDEIRETIVRLMGEGKGSAYAPGTVWNAYNAVTEYTDHVYPVLKTGEVSATKQQAAMLGAMSTVKAKAFDTAVDLLTMSPRDAWRNRLSGNN